MKTKDGWPVIGFEEFRGGHGEHRLALIQETQVLGPDGRWKTACFEVEGRKDGVATPIDCETCGERFFVFTEFSRLPAWAITRAN